MLGVSRQRVNAIVGTHADFPAPVAVLSAGRIWDRDDVLAWAVEHGRSIHEPVPSDCYGVVDRQYPERS